MSKNKRTRTALEELKGYDPFVKKLADERYFGLIRVFNSKTHRLHPAIRDERQARVVLLLVEQMGEITGRAAKLNADERKCLNRIGLNSKAVILGILFFFASLLSDGNQDGIPDVLEGLWPIPCDTRFRIGLPQRSGRVKAN